MDGNGSLFGTLSGNTREILHKFTVELPKKHGRGGQSALRFARLRLEKRHNYVRKVNRPLALHCTTCPAALAAHAARAALPELDASPTLPACLIACCACPVHTLSHGKGLCCQTLHPLPA